MIGRSFTLISLILLFSSCSSVKSSLEKRKRQTKINQLNKTPITDLGVTSKIKKTITSGPTRKFNPDHYVDKTKKWGLDGVKATQLYAIDFNNDRFLDLVLIDEFFDVPVFYKGDGKKFVKLKINPFPETLRANFLLFAHFNEDDLLDVIVGTMNQSKGINRDSLELYLAKKNKKIVQYSKVSSIFKGNLNWPTSTIVPLDYDLDGRLDLFVGNWIKKLGGKKVAVVDRLLKRDEKEIKFLDVSYLLENEHYYDKSKKIYPNSRPTFSASICDIDLNGFPDILTTSTGGLSNRMWLNLYDPKFKERILKDYGLSSGYAADKEGLLLKSGGGNSFYSLCQDYNNDGIFDIAVGEISHSYDSETRDRSSILTGKGREFPPKFIRTEYHSAYQRDRWSQGDRRGNFLDYNNDGLVDLLVDNSGFPPDSRLILFEQEINHAFTDVSENVGINILNPSGSIIVDLNNDGLLDIVTGQTDIRNSNIEKRLYVFENITKREKRRSVRFFLRGSNLNKNAIGATVTLKTSKNEQKRFVHYSYGPMPSQNQEGIHFGIDNSRLDYVEVRWPVVVKDKNDNDVVITKKYDLADFEFSFHTDITLCLNGRFKRKKHFDCGQSQSNDDTAQ